MQSTHACILYFFKGYLLSPRQWSYVCIITSVLWPVNPGQKPVVVALPDQGVLMTVNDFLIKAAALTMEVS